MHSFVSLFLLQLILLGTSGGAVFAHGGRRDGLFGISRQNRNRNTKTKTTNATPGITRTTTTTILSTTLRGGALLDPKLTVGIFSGVGAAVGILMKDAPIDAATSLYGMKKEAVVSSSSSGALTEYFIRDTGIGILANVAMGLVFALKPDATIQDAFLAFNLVWAYSGLYLLLNYPYKFACTLAITVFALSVAAMSQSCALDTIKVMSIFWGLSGPPLILFPEVVCKLWKLDTPKDTVGKNFARTTGYCYFQTFLTLGSMAFIKDIDKFKAFGIGCISWILYYTISSFDDGLIEELGVSRNRMLFLALGQAMVFGVTVF